MLQKLNYENGGQKLLQVRIHRHNEMQRSHVQKNDVLLNITGASIGRCAVYDLDIQANVNQHVTILRIESGKLNYKYLMYSILDENTQNQIWSVQSGDTRQALNYSQIRKLKIPLPPISEQEAIVSRIEKEQSLVNANKELITLYEQKIKDEINKLWME